MVAGVRNDANRKSRHRSVWLPATALILMLSLDGGAVYWLTKPQASANADQASPQKAASKNTGPAKKPANLSTAKSKDVASSQNKKSSNLPPNSGASKAKAAPDVPKVMASKNSAISATPQGKKISPPEQKKTPPQSQKQSKKAVPQTAPALPVVAAITRRHPTAAPSPRRKRTAAITPSLRPTIPKLPPAPPSAPLPHAPDPALVEKTPKGQLPVVGRDGREAWRVYARPFDQLDKRPRIGVVLHGLGTSGAATRTAIQGLPGTITLAFSPYADGLGNWIADARAAGHETLLMVPMEPRNYPDYDPGPQALLTSLTRKQNTERLEWMLGRGTGYVGITDFMGSRFTNSTQHMRALFTNLKKRGLLFLESRVSSRTISGEMAAAIKVPFASSALYIDSQASRSAIDVQLAKAERLAIELGTVVVMGFLYPVTLERLAKWAGTVEKRGIVLAPVSAIAKRRN